MHLSFFVALVSCILVAVMSAELYTSQFDNIDIEGIIRNDKLLDNYYKCLMEEGPCTQEGRTLRSLLPDALQTACAKCTPVQKEKARRVMTYYLDKFPANSVRLMKKYDPDNKFRAGIEKALLGAR